MATHFLQQHRDILCCPRCNGTLDSDVPRIRCASCQQAFDVSDGIPQLFWPNDWEEGETDVTEIVKEFYEKTPFPDYDDFDDVEGLSRKARRGLFARLLDEQIPSKTRILECGCGTGQLSNFLSVANRTVFATDICLNSLRLGHDFARKHGLETVHFAQMNLFRPVFRPGSFHLVISNGVLHHTSDPFLGFRSVASLVKPGGYVLVGLYHRYGRLITDARRILFRVSRDRFRETDPNLRRVESSEEKKTAWFADQYKHPHESKHTIGEVLRWLREVGFRLVRSIPASKPFRTFARDEQLFQPEPAGNPLERLLAELGMIRRGSREGGFFVVIAQRP